MTLPRGFKSSVQANPLLAQRTTSFDNRFGQPAQEDTAQAIVDTLGSPAQVNSSVTLTHTTVTVTTSSTTALAANSSAKYRLFQNIDATNTITISFSVTAVNNTQIVIQPKAQIAFNIEMGNLDTRIVKCICSAGSPVLCVTEGV